MALTPSSGGRSQAEFVCGCAISDLNASSSKNKPEGTAVYRYDMEKQRGGYK